MNSAKLLLIASISMSLLAGCGQTPQKAITSNPSLLPTSDPLTTVMGSSFAITQQTADKYLKANKPLFIEPHELFIKAVVARDSSYHLVDIRSAEHYAAHHIPGAVLISYADVWRSNKTDFLPRDKKIIVIDYSGHSSSQVAVLWSMLGYDAVAMKHGMAGWSKNKDVIGGSPVPCAPKNFATVTDSPAAKTYALAKLEIKAISESELLRKRAEAISAKPVVIQADELLSRVNGKTIFVLDIRETDHYRNGHVASAINIPFRNLMEENNLKKLPPDQPIAIVCYDGHASSQASRLLNQLGYDTIALRDGMSVWAGDSKIIGAKAVACDIPERVTAKLNAPLNPGPSMAAT
jgi:rhodanese-related sulfurtransferase